MTRPAPASRTGGLRKVLGSFSVRETEGDRSAGEHARVRLLVVGRPPLTLLRVCLPASVMSELSSLHEEDRRYELRQGLGRLRSQALTPISDREEESLRGSENRRLLPPTQHGRYEDSPPQSYARRPRSRSMDALDDWDRDQERDSYRGRPKGRGRHGSDDEWRRRDYSPDSLHDHERYGRRSRSRDDLRDLERAHYDDQILEEALRRKRRAGSREELDQASASSGKSSGNRKYRDSGSSGFPPPPPPPPYTETESVSSRGKNDRKLKRVRIEGGLF